MSPLLICKISIWEFPAIDIKKLKFVVLPEMMLEGERLFEGLAALKVAKRQKVAPQQPSTGKRFKSAKTLLEPW